MDGKAGLAFAALALIGAALPARAQEQPTSPTIELDKSFGPDIRVPAVKIDGTEYWDYQIEDHLGHFSKNGENLFFSFRIFGIKEGNIATFSSLQSPERVIAFVTGNELSDISGTLRCTIAGVDLFLLNYKGITFRDRAKLDVQGSFYASSADVLLFDEGDADFGLTEEISDPRLSSATPRAFGFLRDDPAPVRIRFSEGLTVPEHETLAFIGGDDDPGQGEPGVSLIGRSSLGWTDNIRAPGASVQIASAAPGAEIPIDLADLDSQNLAPGTLGDVVFQQDGSIDVSGEGDIPAGEVLIRGERFVLGGDNRIFAEHNHGDTSAVGGIDIDVTGAIQIDDSSEVTTRSRGDGRGGDISLVADSITVSDGSEVRVESWGSQPGPDVFLDAQSVTLSDRGQILSWVSGGDNSMPPASGAGGQIEIRAGSVDVTEGSQIASLNEGTGAGGDIELVTGSLQVTDAGRVYSGTTGRGAGGNLTITGQSVAVSNAAARPEGTLIATETVSTESGAGDGGALTLEVDTVELVDGGQIYARTAGAGRAGALSVTAADSVYISGLSVVDGHDLPSGLTSRAVESATPLEGGLLTIDTRVLTVEGGGQIASSTWGSGRAGDISIAATERITVEGGDGVASIVSAASKGAGPGGDIEIDTDVMELRNGGQITASAGGTGDAGRLVIDANRVEISGAADRTGFNVSGVFSRANSEGLEAGDGGNIEITAARSVVVSNGGRISASSRGTGRAGDIRIAAGDRFESRGGEVTTEAEMSSGGRITIEAREIVYLVGAEVATTVSAGDDDAGDIDIDSEFVVLNGSRIEADAHGGKGGNITIVSEVYLASSDSVVRADSQLSNDGEIEITAPEANLSGDLAALSSSFFDASALLASRCEARRARSGSFVVAGRGGLLAPPDVLLSPLEPHGLGVVAPSDETELCPNWEETP
jgi:filamentous hemagglutinin family protein